MLLGELDFGGPSMDARRRDAEKVSDPRNGHSLVTPKAPRSRPSFGLAGDAGGGEHLFATIPPMKDIPRLQSRARTMTGSPPRGDSVGIWRIEGTCDGSARSSVNRFRIARAISFPSSSPKRIPMRVREPPPNGT